ncbi:MAG: DUF4139 domain-containing protein, partial [Planctomycetes bacterium]|nr:DUF4139 domain-containing protein [Planctomycetota bacterium]
MQDRKWLVLTTSLLGVFAVAVAGYTYLGNAGNADTTNLLGKEKSAEVLPIKQVVLFNSGIGYFQREGEVEGDVRVQLSFPTNDIN